MALDLEQLNTLIVSDSAKAWQRMIDVAVKVNSEPLLGKNITSQVIKRERMVGILDDFLSSCAWDLWQNFGTVVQRNSDRLAEWWKIRYGAKCILILDGLSLRELPWLIEGAKTHGFITHCLTAFGAEIPCKTNMFAHSLGFSSRSELQNNCSNRSTRFGSGKTESINFPWLDCMELIDSSPNWIFWHHWPDAKLHDGSSAGHGLDTLTDEIVRQLTGDDFWNFVGRLAEGRRLVITSDHGYAATGHFYDAEEEQANFLKNSLKSGRSVMGGYDTGPFMPPVTLQIESQHGNHLLAMGRWKWRSQGGYPTLAHGGLSLFEMLCPFIELSKRGS